MVLFLMLQSVATAVTYFLGRDIYAAIIVQNFMGIVGVMAGLPDLEAYRQPIVPVYALTAVSVAALIVSLFITLSRTAKRIAERTKRREEAKDIRKYCLTLRFFR